MEIGAAPPGPVSGYLSVERPSRTDPRKLTDLAALLVTGCTPPTPGRRALILAEAAYTSICEKRLVQVSEIA